MFTSADFRLSDLPASLEELCGQIGFTAVLALVLKFGGIRLHIPKACPDTHPLAVALGSDAAAALCKYMGGEKFDVPRASGLFAAARNREIVANPEGLSASQLAIKHGLVLRTVRKIRAAAAKPTTPPPANVIAMPVRSGRAAA